jgi:hypothetical protein
MSQELLTGIAKSSERKGAPPPRVEMIRSFCFLSQERKAVLDRNYLAG